jgi:hypothetical protein
MTAVEGWVAPTQPAEILETLDAGFTDASSRHGVIARVITVAGYRIGLRFAGRDLADWVIPAFGHLPADVEAPPLHLTIHVWQTGWPGVDIPPGLHRNRDATFAAQSHDGIINAVNVRTGRGYCCVADVDAVRSWDRAAPLRSVLKWWLASRGLHLAHGAAVGRNGSGVLLTGRGGSGKSTTALVCLRAGLDYAGDDWVLIQPDSLLVHSLYASAKLAVSHWSANRSLLPDASLMDPRDEKYLGFLHGAGLVRQLNLRAILVPVVTGDPDTRVVACTPGQALLALAPATMFQLRGDDAATFAAASELVRRLPCFALQLGTQLHRIPGHIDSLLAGLASQRCSR